MSRLTLCVGFALFANGLPVSQVTRAQTATAAPRTVTLPITFHIASVRGENVVPEGFIDERVARANEIYAPYGVAFAKHAELPLGAEHAALENRDDRDALASDVARGVINCFVVASLRDVDDPAEMRRGVHWHARTRPGVHYVIVSSIAGPNVLAHELGHFFGNPKHSDVPGNLMSYQRGEGLPFLEPAQVQRLTRALHDYLRRGEVRALAPK